MKQKIQHSPKTHSMKYNFDEVIERKNTNSVSYEGWKSHIVKEATQEEYIRMWVADMDFSTPPEILEAMHTRLNKKILGYSEVFDDKYFKVLEDWFLKRYNWPIHTKHLVFSPGVVPALNRLVPLLTENNENVLINTPSYYPFYTSTLNNERKIFFSGLKKINGRFEIDYADIEKKLTDTDKNIKLFIHSHPHNPTGRVWTKEELQKLGEICLKNDVFILSDEIHCDLLRRGLQHIPFSSLFPSSDKIITCTAPSKTFNVAGNLLSHIFIPNDKIREEWNRLYSSSLSPLSIAGTQAAYAQCEDWLEELKIYLDGNFKLLDRKIKSLLPHAKFTVPESTYLAWLDISVYLDKIPEGGNVRDFLLKNAKVIVEDSNRFVDNSQGFIRLNLASPRKVIAEGIERIAQALNA